MTLSLGCAAVGWLSALGRSAVLARWGSTVLSLLCAVWLLSASWPASFLILGIVARIDGAEEELAKPQIGGEIDRRLRARHLVLLHLEVGGGVDELADSGLVVQLPQELARLQVISDLCELVAHSALAVGRAGQLAGGVADGVEDGGGGFAGGLAVGDRDDEDGLVELV